MASICMLKYQLQVSLIGCDCKSRQAETRAKEVHESHRVPPLLGCELRDSEPHCTTAQT